LIGLVEKEFQIKAHSFYPLDEKVSHLVYNLAWELCGIEMHKNKDHECFSVLSIY